MQVGSDGVQACGTCHFRAGADPRTKNQISPGLLRVVFRPDEDGNPVGGRIPTSTSTGQGPNATLTKGDFPLRQLANPIGSRVGRSCRTRTTSCPRRACTTRSSARAARQSQDPDGFYVGQGRRRGNVRRVEPRNTPTMINAVFNHRNFWDMRAQNEFNGVNPFGDRDPNAVVYSAATRQSTPQPERRFGS